MNQTPIIDMFSGTGELARAVSAGLIEPSRPVSFSDTYGPARRYLDYRFPDAEVCKDFRDQAVLAGSIVTIGAPRQDLSVAGKRAGAERGSGTWSSLIHEALNMAVAGGADLIAAENVPGGHSTYLALADWLAREHGYRTTVSSAGAWEVGAPHRRERIMIVAARRHFEVHRVSVIRQVAPADLLPTPSVVDRAWGLTPEQRDDVKRRYREKHRNGNGHGETISSVLSRDLEDEEIRLIQTWETVTGVYAPPTGQTCQFMHWMMGLRPRLPDALGLSVSAQRRLAGNAVVAPQARLMLQRGLTAVNDTRGAL
jgi:site-specific DNA-cytosine methylase